jgi:hypothetical protein
VKLVVNRVARFFVGDESERGRDWPLLSLVFLVLLSSATSLANGFAYDDRWIIVENPNVGTAEHWYSPLIDSYWPSIRSAALYRPFAIFGYNVQWIIGDGDPLIFHTINVVLYAAVTILLYRLARELMGPMAAWVAAALFAVHPVHVEAVGNVVGQAELWSGVAVVGGALIYLRARRNGNELTREAGIMIFGLYFVGMLFKETAIVLPAVIAAAEALVVRDPRPLRERSQRTLWLLAWLAVIAVVFLWLRVWLTGEIAGDTEHPSLRHLDMGQRAWVMLGLASDIGRLLIWPSHLSADYSPKMVSVQSSPHLDHLPGALLVLCLIALTIASARRFPIVSFGLAWVIITISPVANIVLPTGILIAERTLFLPSAGVVLCIAGLVPWFERTLPKLPRAAAITAGGVLAIILMAGAAHSAERQRAWKDSDTVFNTLVSESRWSFKGHYALGGMLWDQKRRFEAIREWRYAIALYPTFHGVYQDLAHRYRDAHVCPAAIPLYRKVLELEPEQSPSRMGLAACYLELRNISEGRAVSRRGLSDSLYRTAFEFVICKADSALVAEDSLDATNRWVPPEVRRLLETTGPGPKTEKTPKTGSGTNPQNARSLAVLGLKGLGKVTSKRCKSLMHNN